MTPALLGVVFGSALQLQQPALWDWQAYALLVAFALALMMAGTRRDRSRASVALLAAALFFFGLCGLRALHFSSQALAPALEGRDIAVTGVIAAMPQRNELSLIHI